MSKKRRPQPVMFRWGACAAAIALVLGVVSAAQAGIRIPSVPSTDAAAWTPRVVDDGAVPDAGVYELQQVGTTMYAGGAFNRVLGADGPPAYTRTHLFSFDSGTGAVSDWAPSLDGSVWALEPSADGQHLYIGGEFSSFDGRSVNQLVRYDLAKQSIDASFVFPREVRRVTDLELVGGRLVVAGTFDGGIVAVDPLTGAVDPYFDATQAAGQEDGYTTRVYRFAVNPAGTRMVVLGSFTSIGGELRQQAAMLVLGETAASVSGWSSARWNRDCHKNVKHYTRDVDWSAKGTRFAIVTTGGAAAGTNKLCDTVTWWKNTDEPRQQPIWINHSGGDTFHSVAVTNRGVFAGGHFRWLDNPQGDQTAGPGAVSRRGLGLINTRTGKAKAWNPTKSLEGGRGAYDLYFTDAGLWVGHVEEQISGEQHEGLGLLPY